MIPEGKLEGKRGRGRKISWLKTTCNRLGLDWPSNSFE